MFFFKGRCPIVPTYRLYPFDTNAYNTNGQYMLGDDMIVAPVYAPVLSNGTATVLVYLPDDDGFWVDFNNPASIYAGDFFSIILIPVQAYLY